MGNIGAILKDLESHLKSSSWFRADDIVVKQRPPAPDEEIARCVSQKGQKLIYVWFLPHVAKPLKSSQFNSPCTQESILPIHLDFIAKSIEDDRIFEAVEQAKSLLSGWQPSSLATAQNYSIKLPGLEFSKFYHVGTIKGCWHFAATFNLGLHWRKVSN